MNWSHCYFRMLYYVGSTFTHEHNCTATVLKSSSWEPPVRDGRSFQLKLHSSLSSGTVTRLIRSRPFYKQIQHVWGRGLEGGWP